MEYREYTEGRTDIDDKLIELQNRIDCLKSLMDNSKGNQLTEIFEIIRDTLTELNNEVFKRQGS